jgi:hypothetical protein
MRKFIWRRGRVDVVVVVVIVLIVIEFHCCQVFKLSIVVRFSSYQGIFEGSQLENSFSGQLDNNFNANPTTASADNLITFLPT